MSGIKISVIIATRNRADALETISLPSLVKQDFKDFEVIIWDASNDDKSKIVVEKYIQSHPDMVIRYFKAPRVGSASQRNDAVKVAKGEIVFFIDDDCEVLSNSLGVVYNTLNNSQYCGCQLVIKELESNSKRSRLNFYTYAVTSIIFRLVGGSSRRYVRLSGYGTHESDLFRKISLKKFKVRDPEWIKGGAMAFIKEIFKDHSFNERLQRFGGYALGEDLMFSYSAYLSGCKLTYGKNTYVIHHHASSGRMPSVYVYASWIYNFHLIWKTLIFPRHKMSVIVRWWAVFGYLIVFFAESLSKRNFTPLKGWWIGFKAIFER